MNKKITVYYAKDADEAARIQAVLQANGIEAEEKSLGEHVYHDIYGGNGAYGREIQVEEEKEAQARAAINAWCSGKETTEKSRNLSGKIPPAPVPSEQSPHCRCRPSRHHPSVSEINQTIENGCTRITFRIQ